MSQEPSAERIPHADQMPMLGLGTWQNDDSQQCADSVETALEMGYRHVDTAQIYKNEDAVGDGIAAADVDREDIFLATKVWIDRLSSDDVISSTKDSLDRLGTDYLDLLYVHWPAGEYEPAETLQAFAELYEEGTIRNIGVSNFEPEHVDEARRAIDAPIFANQVELHPLLQQSELREYAADQRAAELDQREDVLDRHRHIRLTEFFTDTLCSGWLNAQQRQSYHSNRDLSTVLFQQCDTIPFRCRTIGTRCDPHHSYLTATVSVNSPRNPLFSVANAMCSTLEFKFNYFNWNIRTIYSSIKTSSTLSIAIPARELRETVFTVVSGGVFSRALCAIRRNCLTSVRAYRRTTVASDTGGLLRTALCLVPIRSPNGDCDTVFTRAIESLVGWTGTCCRDRSIHLDEILVIFWVGVALVANADIALDVFEGKRLVLGPFQYSRWDVKIGRIGSHEYQALTSGSVPVRTSMSTRRRCLQNE